MKLIIQNKIFVFLVFVATLSASKITWFGTYEAKIPDSLKKLNK